MSRVPQLIVLVLSLAFAAMLLTIDRVVTAGPSINQNSNTSTTTQNSNSAPAKRSAKRKSSKPKTETATDPSMPSPNVTTEPTGEAAAPKERGTQTATMQVPTTQTDLSGTYTGTFVCEAAGLNGETTLTINGNEFTTADGKTGRIVASTTRGYTAVALQIGEATATTSPTIISLRGRKTGSRLTLMPVAGSTTDCSFSPTGVAKSRRRGTRQRAVPPATGTEVSNPAMPTTTPAPEAGPAPPPARTKSRRGQVKTDLPPATPEQTPRPSPTPNPEPMPTPSPSPTQTPTPEPSPTASPSPTATPTPEPSPTASPRPTGTPAPSPRPTASPSPSPSPTPTPRPRSA